MRKIVIEKPGSFENLLVEDFQDLKVEGGKILIDVKYIGISFADCIMRMGLYAAAKKYGYPFTPGFEVSGIVKEVGRGVKNFKSGDRVFGLCKFGGYSTQVLLPSRQVFKVPKVMKLSDAGGFLVNHITAFYALHEITRLKSGMSILVHSAAGGVGGATLQIGCAYNCRMVGIVGSSSKVSFAKKIGARYVIDKSKENLWDRASEISPEGYDIILDPNGYTTLNESFKHLGSPGKLVIYGFASMLSKGKGIPNYFKIIYDYIKTPKFTPFDLTMENRSILGFNLAFLFDHEELFVRIIPEILNLVEKKKIIIPKVQEFSFEDVAQAHRELQSGRTMGKLVLKV